MTRANNSGVLSAIRRDLTSLISTGFACLLSHMNILELTVNQLKRAAAIKEQIEELGKELRSIFAGPGKSAAANARE